MSASLQTTVPSESTDFVTVAETSRAEQWNDAVKSAEAKSVVALAANRTGSGRTLFNYINSGPMSEGHVRLYNTDPGPSDQSQNLCLFTPCLFVVGATILSIGITLYVQHKLVVVGIFLGVFGSFSAASAMLYTLIYVCMFGIRSSRRNRTRAGGSKPLTNVSENDSANVGECDQFGRGSTDQTQQTVALHPSPVDFVNEGNGLCGSSYVPSPHRSETVQLNVDSLDVEIKSTQNLDVSVWRTANGDLPQNYLESFGDLPNDLLSSPSLHSGLNGYDDRGESKSHLGKTKNKKRGIFDSLRSGQPFSMKTHGKSNSQTELLNSDNDGENTLFHVESIGKEVDSLRPSTSYQQHHQCPKDTAQEEVTLVENGVAGTSSIVVHFNRNPVDNTSASGVEDTLH